MLLCVSPAVVASVKVVAGQLNCCGYNLRASVANLFSSPLYTQQKLLKY